MYTIYKFCEAKLGRFARLSQSIDKAKGETLSPKLYINSVFKEKL